MIRALKTMAIALALAGCGGDTRSGVQEAPGVAGSTPHFGTWELTARLTLNVTSNGADGPATTSTPIVHVSTVSVRSGGNVIVLSTDSDCALNITVNGDQMTYVENCTVAGVSCTVGFRSTALIRENGVSGSFLPDSFICNNTKVAWAGNLTGIKLE